MTIFEPSVYNIGILSTQHALTEVERQYVVDPFALWLIPRASILGWVVVRLYCIAEFFGCCSAQRNFQALIKTAYAGLELLKGYLETPQGEPARPASTFLSVSFDRQWESRLRYVRQLVCGQDDFPSFEKAQRVVAPTILEEISRTRIPWDLFDHLVHQNRLVGEAESRLKTWIADVKLWGASLSPFLLLSVCEAAAYKALPTGSAGQRGAGAFSLAWNLYKAGFSELSWPDLGPPESALGALTTPLGQEELHVGRKIPLLFPIDFPVTAFEIANDDRFMALISPSPLLLGMWVHNVNECPTAIPCVRIVSCDPRGRYVIVESLLTTLERLQWRGGSQMLANDKAIFDMVADLGKTLLDLPCTLDLEASHLFVTRDFELRTLAPPQERYPFFCLSIVEQLFNDMCHHDRERVQLLFHNIGIRHHPAAQMYRSLIEKFAFAATDPDIRRELTVFDLDEQNFPYVAEWARALRRHVSHIVEQMKSSAHFATLVPTEQTAQIVNAVLWSQEKHGWISCIPVDLVDTIVAEIRARESTLSRTPIQLLAESFL